MGNRTKGSDHERELGRISGGERVPDDGIHEGLNGSPTVDELIINALNGKASPFDRERLRRWREAKAENEDYYQQTAQVWALTAPERATPSSGPPSVEEILAAAPLPFQPNHSRPAADSRARTRLPWAAAGLLAASLAAVGLGVQFYATHSPAPIQEYRAAQGENLTVALTDGSFVRIASGSRLREWESGGGREVSLEGRAFFAVARDETRPFVIRAGSGEVRVLGTRFQVDVEGDEVETMVVEGLVSLSNDAGRVEVPAGSVATMQPGSPPSAREVDDLFTLMDWPDGVLVFQATVLSEVVLEVSRHYGRALRIDGDDLALRRVTAWFQGEPFEAVAESLCIVTEAECRTDGDMVTMALSPEGGVR